jgi:hypothetical protein
MIKCQKNANLQRGEVFKVGLRKRISLVVRAEPTGHRNYRNMENLITKTKINFDIFDALGLYIYCCYHF